LLLHRLGELRCALSENCDDEKSASRIAEEIRHNEDRLASLEIASKQDLIERVNFGIYLCRHDRLDKDLVSKTFYQIRRFVLSKDP